MGYSFSKPIMTSPPKLGDICEEDGGVVVVIHMIQDYVRNHPYFENGGIVESVAKYLRAIEEKTYAGFLDEADSPSSPEMQTPPASSGTSSSSTIPPPPSELSSSSSSSGYIKLSPDSTPTPTPSPSSSSTTSSSSSELNLLASRAALADRIENVLYERLRFLPRGEWRWVLVNLVALIRVPRSVFIEEWEIELFHV